MAHKHAELMALYAQDAMDTDTPWELWECNTGGVLGWVDVLYHPAWLIGTSYRRKPKMISVTLKNGDVLSWPEPYTGALLLGTSYWSVGLTEVRRHTWSNSHIEQLVKEQGLLYLVKEDAEEALVVRQVIFTQGMK
jgi:hypothetical protein